MKRVPGVRHYRALDQGLRELGRSSGMSAASVEAAQRVASAANAQGRGTYEAAPETVRAGYEPQELRSGAVVREVEHEWKDSRDRVLVTVLEAMKVRGSR